YRERKKLGMGFEFDKGWLDSRSLESAVKTIGLPVKDLLLELRGRVK
ncbi:unnamed protein product, partial [marine sediment metagenome]